VGVQVSGLSAVQPDISLEGMIQIIIMLGGLMIWIGMFRAKSGQMEEKVDHLDKRFEETVAAIEDRLDKFGEQLTQIAVVHSQLTAMSQRITQQDAEILRCRDRLHDLEGTLRGVQHRESLRQK